MQLAETLEMVVSQVLVSAADGRKRHLACEIMVMTTAIRQLIRSRKTHLIPTEIETGLQLGSMPLEKSLRALVKAGKISTDAALPWVHDKRMFEGA